MPKQLRTLAIFALAVVGISAAAFFLVPAPQQDDAGRAVLEDGRPAVAVTIFPLADIVRNVAGDGIRVELILPPGASPHTFEPTPSVVQRVAGVSVVYAIGHGLDDWALPLREEARAGYVGVDKGIELRASVDDEEGPMDPHYWLDVRNAILIARTVRDDLSIRFPGQAATFRQNEEAYVARLEALDAEIREALRGIDNPNIVTLHDAWYYFVDAYGLTITGTYEPSAGREPTPTYLAELSEGIAAAGTRVLFTEPGISTESIAGFVADNGLIVRQLDPEGGGIAGRESYIELMRYNVATLLGKEPVY